MSSALPYQTVRYGEWTQHTFSSVPSEHSSFLYIHPLFSRQGCQPSSWVSHYGTFLGTFSPFRHYWTLRWFASLWPFGGHFVTMGHFVGMRHFVTMATIGHLVTLGRFAIMGHYVTMVIIGHYVTMAIMGHVDDIFGNHFGTFCQFGTYFRHFGLRQYGTSRHSKSLWCIF